MSQGDVVTISLERNVALVLFDFLARVADEEEGEPLRDAILHEAELPTLWELLGELDETLTEPFAEDFAQRIQDARARVVARCGGAMP